MRANERPAGYLIPRVLATLSALALAAACAGPTTTPGPTGSGLTSVAPPVTASPSPGPTASPTSIASPTTAPTTTPDTSPTPFGVVTIGLTKVASGLSGSIGAVSAGDDRLFVIEQAGKIVIVSGGAVTGTFLDITGRTSSGGERGLIGLAFHPGYLSNGRFFVRYTDPAGDVRISEFHVSADPNKADPASEKPILTIPHPSYANHNGGTIAFGPDGYLYIGTGDGGSAGDPNNNGQNLNSLLGKMLRIGIDQSSGSANYVIPADNPFVGQAGKRGEIWAYGLRNPYGYSFDRQTGDLWIADVGQNLWEEVDRSTAASGGGRGADYGWSVMEARHCYKPSTGCKTTGMTMPIAEYNHGSGDSTGCSIIGGFVYRGSAHPELVGRYFFGDYCSGKIWDLQADGPSTQTPQFLLAAGFKIMGWGQATDGELYVVAENGTLYQLT